MKIPTKSLELYLEDWREHCSTGCHVSFLVAPEDLEYFKMATIKKGKMAGQRYACVLVELAADETPAPENKPEPPKPPKPETKEAKAAREAAEFHAKTPDLLAPVQGEDKVGLVELPGGTIGVPFVAQPDGSMARTLPTDSGMLEEAANHVSRHGFPPGLAGLSVMWSTSNAFHEWLHENFPTEWDATGNPDDYATPEERAKAVIQAVCAIGSRKELDTDKRAAKVFDLQFREPYAAFQHDAHEEEPRAVRNA